jgi:hypothetical protein
MVVQQVVECTVEIYILNNQKNSLSGTGICTKRVTLVELTKQKPLELFLHIKILNKYQCCTPGRW